MAMLLGSPAAFAQTGASEPAAAPSTAADPVQALIQVLEDPDRRTELLERLRAAQAAEPTGSAGEPAAADPSPAPGETAPAIVEDAAANTMIGEGVRAIRAAFARLVDFAREASDIELLSGWIRIQAGASETAAFWGDFFRGLAGVAAIGTAAYFGTQFALRRWRRRLAQPFFDPASKAVAADAADDDAVDQEPASLRRERPLWQQLAWLAAVDAAPTLVALAAALLARWLLPFPLRTELVALDFVVAATSVLVIAIVLRVLLRPGLQRARILRSSEIDADEARELYRRCLWLAGNGLIGWSIFDNIEPLRIPPGVFEGVERLWGLVILGQVIALVLAYRGEIAAWIVGSTGRFAMLRAVLARTWLPVVLLYAIGTYVIWALEIYGGFALLWQGGLGSILVLLAAQTVSHLLNRWLQRLTAREAMTALGTAVQRELQRYAGGLRAIVGFVLYGGTAIALAQVWGIPLEAWLASVLSGDTVAAIGDVLLVVALCAGIWIGIDIAILAFLAARDENGRPVERTARTRTLLPLFQTLLFVVLAVVLLAVLLTSAGLDVAPLLATAGVIGIAVGFGAQKLVQDVITGLFMLFQDTLSVGDVVAVAGHSGTVERITVRTLELRDLEGALHTIPFSAVTTVKNMTRDFAFAMFDIGVAYSENIEQVTEVLLHLGAEFERNPTHGPDLLSSLEMFGVQQLGDNSIVIRCRFKVRPMTQWAVRRAFLAAVKTRFDELGISIPFPQRTLHFAAGDAPLFAARAAEDAPSEPSPKEAS